MLLVIFGVVISTSDSSRSLNVLLIHSMFPSHYFPLMSLGAELVSRGHNVSILGPTLEGYEQLPKLARANGLSYIESVYLPRSEYDRFRMYAKNDGNSSTLWTMFNLLKFMYDSINEDRVNYMIEARKKMDQLNGSDFDFVVAENAACHNLYYAHKKWKTSKVMLVDTLIGINAKYTIPWSYPYLFSPYSDNMTFKQRLINTVVFAPVDLLMRKTLLNYAPEEQLKPLVDMIDFFMGVPVLHNTVIGMEYPRTILPLEHFVGPMFLPKSNPLSDELEDFLGNNINNQSIIYISMGTTGEITRDVAISFLELSKDHKLVWSMRQSNQGILEGIDVNKENVYISSWISQYTFLQHPSVILAILHCGLNGIQESLYNAIPVLCVPYGADQYDLAHRLVHWKTGSYIYPDDITSDKITSVVNTMLSDEDYKRNAYKMSRLFKVSGGVKKGADLVEFYADIDYTYAVPSFIKYQWSFVEFYNLDVWFVILALMVLAVLSCKFLCNKCCFSCCCRSNRKIKNE
jgi:glucuronosyltransferase